jgi:hypothetical protein
MIDAADAFGTAASDAVVKARDAIRAADDARQPHMATRAVAWEARDLALMQSSRLDLLFGPDTEAVGHATKLVKALGGRNLSVRKPRGSRRAAASGSLTPQGTLANDR